MNTHSSNIHRKGQSAIEYLMTYGWMLLVVAIVGGAVVTTMQQNQSSCKAEIRDIKATQQQFGVQDFGANDAGLQVVLSNNYREDVTVTNVTVNGNANSTTKTVGFGEEAKILISGITASDQCNTYDISVTYDKGSLTSQEISGELKGKMS